MNLWSAIYAFLQLSIVSIRAFRDPAWSTKNQEIRDAHVERISEFARTSREWAAHVQDFERENRTETRENLDRSSDRLRELWLQELAADGSYLGEHAGVREPTVEVPISVLDATFAALSGRRRDAELGQHGATLNQSSAT